MSSLRSITIPVEWFLIGGLVCNFIINATIRWSARTWYFIPFNLFLAIGIAWLLELLRREGKLRTDIAVAAALLTLAIFYISWSKDLKDRSANQLQIFASVEWMNANLPQTATVGAFNAGIQGYFSRYRTVNLDGLVNNHAYEALKQKDLWSYVESAKIGYLADFPTYFSYRFRSFLGQPDILRTSTLVQPSDPANGGLVIYRLQ